MRRGFYRDGVRSSHVCMFRNIFRHLKVRKQHAGRYITVCTVYIYTVIYFFVVSNPQKESLMCPDKEFRERLVFIRVQTQKRRCGHCDGDVRSRRRSSDGRVSEDVDFKLVGTKH